MYALYEVVRSGSETGFRFEREVCLFGCRQGTVPLLLERQIPESVGQPHFWHVSLREALQARDDADLALVINLKPNSQKPNLSLYELTDTWGHSANGWTPILLKLDGLFVDADPGLFDWKHFTRSDAEIDGPIYSFLYAEGTLEGGRLKGKWTAPPRSSTNSVLLWPDTLKYFASCIKQESPQLIPSQASREG